MSQPLDATTRPDPGGSLRHPSSPPLHAIGGGSGLITGHTPTHLLASCNAGNIGKLTWLLALPRRAASTERHELAQLSALPHATTPAQHHPLIAPDLTPPPHGLEPHPHGSERAPWRRGRRKGKAWVGLGGDCAIAAGVICKNGENSIFLSFALK
jgi:hypothetical protein